MSDLEEEVWCAEHPKEAAARIEALELEKGRLQTRIEALERALRSALRVMDHPAGPARQGVIDRASAVLSASGSASSPPRWPPE